MERISEEVPQTARLFELLEFIHTSQRGFVSEVRIDCRKRPVSDSALETARKLDTSGGDRIQEEASKESSSMRRAATGFARALSKLIEILKSEGITEV